MRKLVMTVLIAALLGTACGGGGKKDDDGQYGSDLLTATTNTVAPGATTAPTAAPAGGGKSSTKTTVRGTATTARTSSSKDPIEEASHGGDGEFGGMLLSASSPVRKIIYEVLHQEGLDLAKQALDHTLGQLRQFSGKTVQLERTPIPPGPSTWDTAALGRYIDRYTRFKQGGDTGVLHVLVVHGSLPGASGVAFRGDGMAVFPDTYRRGAITISKDDVEDIVVMHETGHVAGLVDLYLSTGRGDYTEDPAPGGHHSRNHRSVMYWRVDSISVSSVFEGGPPREYDNDDKADLTAIHNGAPKGAKSRTARMATPRVVQATPFGIGVAGLL